MTQKSFRHLFYILPLFTTLYGQAQSIPTTVKFNKVTVPAQQLRVPYTNEVAEGAIIQKLKEIGYSPQTSGALLWKKNTVDGYYVFRNVALKGLGGKLSDLYFKVDEVSRKNKGESSIFLLVARMPEQFASAESEADAYNAGTAFLNGLQDYSAGYKLDLDIAAQEELVRGARKQYDKLKAEGKELSEKLQANQVQQESQAKLLEGEQIKLEALRKKKGG